ncbi:CHAT domain-containing protein [Streptomyces sp. WAC06614]|uniref:CHAT domain-containing protein n=1 Tax=Streptomyces sp. WAC06614 TaxID=2487416 RepID=UPI000F7A91C2|nr:CHAT domain-containing protein [Streptomyces sp. WAC06614]RSS80673.1 CHAT domain-containing protein [Streptomyces sp. WAC06614]
MSAESVRVILVEYYVTEHGIRIFGILPEAETPQIRTVALTRADLRASANAFYALVRGERFRMADHLAGEALRALVRPIEEWAAPGDVVHLVPHDALHRLPLHAVPLGGAPLADRNPVVLTPSASVLRYCWSQRKATRSSVLVVAAPPADPPMTFAHTQATAVSRLFGEPEVLVGARASRAALLERLRAGNESPDVLHFTAHGVFEPDDPMRSGVELADGRLTAEDILGLSLAVDLVVLGSCESGLSKRRPGDELLGLTRALLYAGAASTLVSLWRVDELSTGLLLTRFYEELRAGSSKAESLRRAQRWLRGLTHADVLRHAQEVRSAPAHGSPLGAALLLEEARLLARAGDVGAALRVYDALSADRGLAEGLRTAARVRAAQVRLARPLLQRRSGEEKAFPDPYHWAPFVLTGDWC